MYLDQTTERNGLSDVSLRRVTASRAWQGEGFRNMGGIIYLVGLVVVVMAVLSLIGLG